MIRLTKGSGRSLESLASRVERIEMFLSPYAKETAFFPILGVEGICQGDILASRGGEPFDAKNLDLNVVSLYFDGNNFNETGRHLLCWRKGFYAGKFEMGDPEIPDVPAGEDLETDTVVKLDGC